MSAHEAVRAREAARFRKGIPMGGKPSKGTRADKRLAVNRAPKPPAKPKPSK